MSATAGPTGRAFLGAVVPLAEVVRSGHVESVHHGALVVTDAAGAPLLRLGDPAATIYPRSSVKPVQATGMLRAGLDLDGELLALACSSHSGEPMHLDGVQRILAGAGLGPSALQTPPDLPLGADARAAWLRAGAAAQPIAMNCSGKHAAMLRTCVRAGWSLATYRDPGHPLQLALRATLEDLAGEPVAATSVDGCGAPLFAISLAGLARAFARLATAAADSAEGRVAAAVRSQPLALGGTGRDVTRLVAGVPGLVAKDGAEGVFAAALPDGRALAVKVADGADRARAPVVAAVLRRLGVDLTGLADLLEPPVLGGGRPVGAVRPVAAVTG